MVGYCALLVHCNLFQSATISFHPVGHTHEDIDQVFSCVHKKLMRTNMPSRRQMGDIFSTAFFRSGEIKAHYEFWDYIPDISGFLKDVPKLDGIRNFRQILVQSKENMGVVAQFREHTGGSNDNFGGLSDKETEVVILPPTFDRVLSPASVPKCQLSTMDGNTVSLIKRDVQEIASTYNFSEADRSDLETLLRLLSQSPNDNVLCPWQADDYVSTTPSGEQVVRRTQLTTRESAMIICK